MSIVKPSKRFRIFARDQFTCQYCGRKAPDVQLEVDHVHPRSRGGGNEDVNLATSCTDCNRSKGSIVLRGASRAEAKHNADFETFDPDTLQTAGCGFIGLYFHARGERGWQGQIVRELDRDCVLVQLFSWLDGEPTVVKTVPKSAIVSEDWLLFGTHAQFRKITDAWLEESYRREDV